jgi:hypothetical protein
MYAFSCDLCDERVRMHPFTPLQTPLDVHVLASMVVTAQDCGRVTLGELPVCSSTIGWKARLSVCRQQQVPSAKEEARLG